MRYQACCKGRLCLFLVVVMLVMMLAPAVMARPVERQNYLVGFRQVPGPAEYSLLHSSGGKVIKAFSITPTVLVELPDRALPVLARNPLVEYIEPDGEMVALGTADSWGIDRVNAPSVWEVTAGTGVKVAVLDTGIDASHADLNVYGGTNTIDGTGTGDGNGHGTHVAGTIAALNIGKVVGVAPAAHLYSVKVLNDNGSGTVSSVVAGIEWAVASGMQIINMSLGSGSDSSTLRNACNAAYESGLLLVAAAGNSGNPPGSGNNVSYPARYDSVIAVAAIDMNNRRASFSSTGPAVELSAPGVDINSTYINSAYATASGTSMASPHVSGVAALVWAYRPGLTNLELRHLLSSTATDLGALGRDSHFGFGLVNARAAVEALAPAPEPEPVKEGKAFGYVYTAGGEGIPGARVAAGSGQSTLTDSNGYYSITLPAGEHQLTASAQGYYDQTVTVQVPAAGMIEQDFCLDPVEQPEAGQLVVNVMTDKTTYTGNSWVNITVTVTYGDKPVTGESVAVTVKDPGGGTQGTYSAVTGSDGKAVVRHRLKRNDPKGTWKVTAKTGEAFAETTFQVQ